MSTLTDAELALLRTQPHRSRFYLSIYEPNTVLACQVTGSVEKGDQEITYDSESEGSYLLVKRGMTLLVGSSAGDDDMGSVYVKSATATTITVGENSHINWSDDLYLTILDFFQVWPVYPRYTSDDEDITVYKDYDVEYTDQNSVLGSLICMGPNHAGFLDTSTGTSSVYYSASGTSNLTTGTNSFHWHFVGGTPTGSHVQTPGNILYGEAGHFSTYLTVSGTAGSVETSTRHISIYDRPEDGPNPPVLSWGFDGELSGDRDSGGSSIRLWVKEDIGSIQDGALVIIFADDWYGTTKQSIGGYFPNRESTIFVGYIIGSSIDYDWQDSKITFRVSSPTELMKQVEAFSVSVEDSTDPDADATAKGGSPWFYMERLSMETALYHYIRWHTTINLCMDVEYSATDFNLQFFDADRSSLYDAVNALMESAVVGATVCDRQGKLWFEIEYEAIDDAENELVLGLNVLDQDWINTQSIQERRVNDLSFLEMGGVYWQGAEANTFSALLTAAPGTVPAYRGKPIRLHGLALSSQDQLNALVGNVYANRNARFPEVSIDVVGNYRNFDIAPQEQVTLTLQDRTFRELNWDDKSFAIRRVSHRMNQNTQMMSPSLVVAEVVQGFDADTIVVPEVAPSDGWTVDPITIPVFPEWPKIEIPSLIAGDTFVQATYGYNQTPAPDETIYPGWDSQNGWNIDMSFDQDITCYGHWKLPNGVSSVTFYPIFNGDCDSGNLRLSHWIEYNVVGGGLSTNTDGFSSQSFPFPDVTMNEGDCAWGYTAPELAVSLTLIGGGDVCTMLFRRDADNVGDTYEDSIWFIGWWIIYG